MKHKQYDFRTAYIDLLLNVLTGMIFLFVLTTLLIQPKTKENEGVKRNAQFIMDVVWSKDIDCDVDVWVQDPSGLIVWFQEKDRGLMHIERDDLGFRNDRSSFSKAEIISDENKETWVLRGIKSGRYTVNVHLYACRVNDIPVVIDTTAALAVTATLMKINPTVQEVHVETVMIERVWEEKTMFNFTLDTEGNVTSITHINKNLVKEKGR